MAGGATSRRRERGGAGVEYALVLTGLVAMVASMSGLLEHSNRDYQQRTALEIGGEQIPVPTLLPPTTIPTTTTTIPTTASTTTSTTTTTVATTIASTSTTASGTSTTTSSSTSITSTTVASTTTTSSTTTTVFNPGMG